MTPRELRRRVYLETANAICVYVNGLEKSRERGPDSDIIDAALLESATHFLEAADAIKETQETGIE